MLDKTLSARWFIGGVVFFLLIVGSSLSYHLHIRQSHKEEVEQTKRSVQALKNKKEVHTEEDITEISPSVSEYMTNTLDIHESGMPPHDPSGAVEIDSFQTHSGDELLLLNTEEDPLPIGSAEDFNLEDLADWTEDLQARMQAKYPEIMEFPTLTAEEIASRYSTDEDRQRFHQLAQQMLEDFLGETKELLSSLPNEISVQVMEELHHQLSANWGQESADKVISDLQQLIE